MKKLLYLFLILVLSFSLWACGSTECTEHIDENGDLLCDNCETGVPCTAHVDENDDLSCDKCSQPVPCTNHKDDDGNIVCDRCGASLPCTLHKDSDKNLVCDLCQAEIECTHVDNNNDSICDIAACGWNYGHTHTYKPNWSSDQTSHWHAPSCSHSIEPKDKAAHKDADNDGACDVCSWNNNHTHTYDTESWEKNESEHWHKATCGHSVKSDKAAHVDENGICSVCGYVLCTHEFDAENWMSDENGHWHPAKCEHTTAQGDVIPHTYNDDGICTVCEYDSGHEHKYKTEWTTDATYHWHDSDCGHPTKIDAKATHKDCDENKDGVCDKCQYVYCNHEYSAEWTKDADGHWHEATCGCNVAPADKETHVDEINDGICDICGYQICAHTFNENAWEHNATHHWHPANCVHTAQQGGYEEHTDTNNDGICEICTDENGNPYQFCNHFSHEWTSDGTYHWHEKICEHTAAEDVKDKKQHSDDGQDGVCDVCKHQICNHDGNIDYDSWKDDGTYHWHMASCCPNAKIDYAAHTDKDANLKCDTCQHAWEDPNPENPDIGDSILTPPHIIGKPKDE